MTLLPRFLSQSSVKAIYPKHINPLTDKTKLKELLSLHESKILIYFLNASPTSTLREASGNCVHFKPMSSVLLL